MEQKNIAVYVTGGIAAYKIPSLVRLLVKSGANVRVAMTKAATEFVTPLTLQIVSKHKVHVDLFDEDDPTSVQHIELADWSDVALVVPATANMIAKLAHGMADDIVSSALLATTCPKIIAPAMNEHMYENTATQRNIRQLQEDGYVVIEPEVGFLAEGYHGKGRLASEEKIVATVEKTLSQTQEWAGKHVLITAGGTIERIDPVRYISNDSSGKMGYALAKAAASMGAVVTLVSTKKNLLVPVGVQVVYVTSAKEMYEVVHHYFNQQDIVIMAAAVSDFRIKQVEEHKIKKQVNTDTLTLELVKNPDILASLGATKQKHQLVVGFAAETRDVVAYAKEKLQRKNVDAIIANNVADSTIGFNANENEVTIVCKDGRVIPLEKASKETIAVQILQQLTMN